MAERQSTKTTSAGGARARKSKAAKPSSRGTASKAKRTAAARKGGQARGRQQTAQKGAAKAANAATKPAESADVSAKTVAELREALRQNLIRPLDMMLITRERVEQALNEAVERGQVTVDGAQGIASTIIERGRKQTNDVLQDLERLLDRGRGGIDDRAGAARKQVSGARSKATRAASPALAQTDRLRRAAGVGPSFPITAFDDLTAAQVQGRLTGLTPAELRKVRDYERRNANRKTVLNAIESKLG